MSWREEMKSPATGFVDHLEDVLYSWYKFYWSMGTIIKFLLFPIQIIMFVLNILLSPWITTFGLADYGFDGRDADVAEPAAHRFHRDFDKNNKLSKYHWRDQIDQELKNHNFRY